MWSIDLTDIPWTAPRACYSPCWAIKLMGYWTSSCFPSFSLSFPPTRSNLPKTHSSGKALQAQCNESLMKLSLFYIHLLCCCGSNNEIQSGAAPVRASWCHLESLNVITISMSVHQTTCSSVWNTSVYNEKVWVTIGTSWSFYVEMSFPIQPWQSKYII